MNAIHWLRCNTGPSTRRPGLGCLLSVIRVQMAVAARARYRESSYGSTKGKKTGRREEKFTTKRETEDGRENEE